jgi:drug/metabolite transporter (DMT)-like permease
MLFRKEKALNLITSRIVIVMFLWAICFPLIVTGLPLMPHLFFATLRAVIAGVFLLGIAFYLKRPMPGNWTFWWQITVIGIGATTFGFIGMFHAAEFVSPGLATVIANAQPLLAALLGHHILRERLTIKRQGGLFLGFAGILIITIPRLINGNAESYALGIGYIFLAALGITVSNVMIKKMSKKVDALVAMGWQLVLGAIPLGVLSLFTEDITAATWSVKFVYSLLGLAFFGTALVYWMWCRVLREVPLVQANAFNFLVPLFGITMGVAFYNETITVTIIIGTIISVLGIWVTARAK